VWGWNGFLAMDDQVLNGVKVDSFVSTPVSSKEKQWIDRYLSIKEKILKGERYNNIESPVDAFLTRLSAYIHSDPEALDDVEIVSAPFDTASFQKPETQKRIEYLKKLDIWRVHLPGAISKERDAVPIFTSEDDTHVYFYYRGGWRYLYKTAYVWLWQDRLDEELKKGLDVLKSR
jgi:hypothetical protein